MSDMRFPDGFYYNEGKGSAKAFMKIKKEKFLGWLADEKTDDKGFVTLIAREKRSGDGLYCHVSDPDWKPDPNRHKSGGSSEGAPSAPPVPKDESFGDDIPF